MRNRSQSSASRARKRLSSSIADELPPHSQGDEPHSKNNNNRAQRRRGSRIPSRGAQRDHSIDENSSAMLSPSHRQDPWLPHKPTHKKHPQTPISQHPTNKSQCESASSRSSWTKPNFDSSTKFKRSSRSTKPARRSYSRSWKQEKASSDQPLQEKQAQDQQSVLRKQVIRSSRLSSAPQQNQQQLQRQQQQSISGSVFLQLAEPDQTNDSEEKDILMLDIDAEIAAVQRAFEFKTVEHHKHTHNDVSTPPPAPTSVEKFQAIRELATQITTAALQVKDEPVSRMFCRAKCSAAPDAKTLRQAALMYGRRRPSVERQ